MHYLPGNLDHDHLDDRPRVRSPARRIVVAALFILAMSALPARWDGEAAGISARHGYLGGALLLAGVMVLADLGWTYLVRRWLYFVPGVALAAGSVLLQPGESAWPLFWGLITKATLAFTALVILVRSTPLDDLLLGLRRLGVPRLIVAVLGMMDRYVFLFRDEFRRLERAQAARQGACSWFGRLRRRAGLLGMVLVRSLDRSQRVHAAMLARGSRVR